MALYVLAFSSCVTLVNTLLQLRMDYTNDVGQMRGRFILIRNSYLSSIAASAWKIDEEHLREQIAGIQRLPDVSSVRIETSDGLRLAVGDASPVRVLTESFPLTHEYRDDVISLGTLTVSQSLDAVYQRLWDKVVVILITQGIKTFLVSIFILLIFRALLTRHLEFLSRHLANMAPDRLSERFVLQRKRNRDNRGDELDLVMLSINDMQFKLREAYRKLEKFLEEESLARENLDRLFREASDARREAEKANRLKDEFLLVLSHELRTPLTPILGWVQMLKALPPTAPRLLEGLDAIEASAHHQLRLVDDLLEMSSFLSGDARLPAHRLDVRDVLGQALDLVRPRASSRRITLTTRFVADGDLVVVGDSMHLRQALWNVLNNAVKFNQDGGWVRVGLERAGEDRVALIVEDGGIGIPSTFLPHIFDHFTQADTSLSRVYGGLGLGLAIVRRIIESHGGEIRAESAGENQGSTFTILLPLEKKRTVSRENERTSPSER